MQIRLLAALAIAILAVFFALQNATPVDVNLLFWQIKGSLAVVLLITLLLGVVLSLLIAMPATVKRRRSDASHLKKEMELEKSLADRDAKIRELEARLSQQPAPSASLPTPAPAPSLSQQPEPSPSSKLPPQ
jgi:uncharacterized integral membrane protein